MAIVIGTNGADDLDGTANNDLIISGNGADIIEAGDGNDLIFSGRGDDTVDAGAGNDVVFAGNGDDTVDGGDGHDLIFGGRGDDTINGGSGNDLIYGGSGDDIIDGGEGCDIVSAGSGNDLVIFDVDENSGAQNYFSGGSGNDTLRLRLTQSQVNEMTAAGVFAAFNAHVGSSGGFDFSTFGLSFAFNLKVWRFEQIEVELTSSPGLFTENNDTFDFNTVIAATYEDGTQYDGLGGDDTVVLANNAAAAAAAGYVVGTAFNAGAGNDTVTGGALDDIINGDAGNDVLNGGTGVDVLNGGDDDDRLILEDINVGDSVDGGDGDDTFVFAAANGSGHTISVAASQVTADGTTISVTNVENYEISGADMADSLSSTAGKTSFFGLGGNDNIFLTGNNLGDSVDGGDDFDIVFYSDIDAFGGSLNINNVITVSTTDITVDGTVIALTDVERVVISSRDGDDMITGSNNSDSLGGNDGNDTINGEGGGDSISGGSGLDNLFGGAGNDSLSLSDISFGDNVDGGADTDTFVFTGSATTDILVDLNAGTISEVGGTVGSIVNVQSVTSGGGNDVITGDGASNILNGGAGDDDLFSGGGDDVLIGGSGFNRLFAATGVDLIQGGDDVDQAFIEDLDGDTGDGGAGFDSLIFNFASGVNMDLATGAASLVGGGGSGTFTNFESVVSQGGGATASGTNNRDAFTYNGGGNTINALGGDDEIRVDGAGDVIDGGTGTDNLVFQTIEDVDLNLATGVSTIATVGGTITSIESVVTGSGNDNIIGTVGDDNITSGGGNDFINGFTGNDIINGGDGSDFITVNDLGDLINAGNDVDTIQFDIGQSVNIDLATGVATAVGGGSGGNYEEFEGVRILGAGGATVSGTNTSNNTFVQGTGNTVTLLDGNDNVDLNNGGNDVDGGAGTFDSVRFSTGSSAVIVDLSGPTGFATVNGLTGDVIGFEVVRTGDGDDILTGSAANDRFESGTGMDTINTGDGDDVIFVQDGDDTLDGGAGFNDTVTVVTMENVVADLAAGTLDIGAQDQTSLTNIENITGGGGDDQLLGGDFVRDRLIGGAGDDELTSGLVNAGERDALSGEDGNDTIIINGPRVQASGGDGMDTFVFVDNPLNLGTQNAILFDVDVAEMDTINLTSWGLGLTAIDIQNDVTMNLQSIVTQGPTANDSNLSFDGGNLTMTVFGINTADIGTFADDIFIF